MIVEIENDDLQGILDNKNIVILYFKADWCGPCRMYGPILETFSEENPNITIGKVNVDINNEISAKYGIRNIPTTIVFDNGEPVNRVSGVIQKDKLLEMIKI
jgi:thioredoxin 1